VQYRRRGVVGKTVRFFSLFEIKYFACQWSAIKMKYHRLASTLKVAGWFQIIKREKERDGDREASKTINDIIMSTSRWGKRRLNGFR